MCCLIFFFLQNATVLYNLILHKFSHGALETNSISFSRQSQIIKEEKEKFP